MPRIPRLVVTGNPHHVTQRGNYKQKTFSSEADYSQYLKWMHLYIIKYALSVLAYCLMPNHVHFIVIPLKNDSMARTFNSCHMRYAQFFNKKAKKTGHLWQSRFYSCALDPAHLFEVVRYVENNPVRANLVSTPKDWKWSSARHHLYGEPSMLPLSDISSFLNIDNWQDYLNSASDNSVIQKINTNTLTGRPSGSKAFISRLESIFNRRLHPLPEGRPPVKTSRCP